VKLLLHVCCAHCLARALAGLRAEFAINGEPAGEPPRPRLAVEGLFFNPNIHPLAEFRKRLRATELYLERDPLPMRFVADYGLLPFCRRLDGAFERPERCRRCYAMRFERTAIEAAEEGFSSFSTTLLTSREQDHRLLQETAERVASAQRINFLYRDLRAAVAPAGLVKLLYRQRHCGCVFSESERGPGLASDEAVGRIAPRSEGESP